MTYKTILFARPAILALSIFLSASISGGNSSIPVAASYPEIQLGSQVWMASNLDVVSFRNGDTLLQAKTKEEWRKANAAKKPAWCYYNNDPENGKMYGKLYNWSAVTDKRGLAPAGWRIPTDKDWRTLSAFAAKNGINLKSGEGWQKNCGSGIAGGFGAVAAGTRDMALIGANNGFRWMGSLAIWWSATKPGGYADVACFFIRCNGKAGTEWHSTSDGFSVRCIRE